MAQKDQLMQLKSKEDEAEKTAFERFEQELKQTIYGVMFILLKEEENTFWKIVVLNTICEIQFLCIIFSQAIDYPWKSEDFATYFKGFLHLFQVMYWASLLSYTAYLIIFYFCVFLLVVVVVSIAYAVYLFTNKKFSVMWPFYIMRTVCTLCISVFFYPLLDLYSSMFQCENKNGTSVHYAFSETICWKEMHILHAVAGIIAFFIYSVISLVVVLCFFEAKISSSDPSARVHSRNEFWTMLFKIFCLLISNFFLDNSYRWMNTIAVLIGGMFIYIKQRHERPYYDEAVNISYDVLNGIFMWSTFMLVVVMLTEDSDFNGGFQIFLMGVPLIVLMLIIKEDPRKEYLLKNIESFDNGEMWYSKVRYFISLIQRKDASRDVSAQLKGYLYNHEEKCTNSSCPIKIYHTNLANMVKDKKKKMPKAAVENFNLLMRFANNLFIQGISKFPSCSTLRIAYSYFLKERMNNRTLAINELLSAERCNPSFDEQFVIYRYRKIIEDEMADVQADGQSGGSLNAISMIAYENYLRQFKESVERTALLHMEFWLEVLEPEPDLGKLDKTGSKIHASIVNVDDYWAKLQKVNPNSPKALRIYADFLIDVLNDSESGGELLSRAKETAITKTFVNTNIFDAAGIAGVGDMPSVLGGGDGTPCVIASGEQGKIGEMLQCNNAVCRLTGYTKTELIGRRINQLMPEIYSRYHDKILQKCLNNTDDIQNGEKSEILVLARHKSQYIIPIFLLSRTITSVSQGTLFVATLKQEKKVINVCYLLLDEHQDIVGVSSKCISMLKLTNHLLKKSRVSMQTLAPVLQDKSAIAQFSATNLGAPIDFFIPEESIEDEAQEDFSSIMQKGIMESNLKLEAPAKKLRVKASKKSVNLMCVMTELVICGEQCGYLVRLEIPEDNKDFSISAKLDKVPRYPDIQFAFDPANMKYVQENFAEDAQKRIADEMGGFVSIMRDRSQSSFTPIKSEDDRMDSSMISMPQGGDIISQIQYKLHTKKKYGDNIKTRRIVNGEEIDIEGVKSRLIEREQEEAIDEEEAKRREGKDEKKDDIFQSSLKSKKAFNEALNEKSVPPSIKKLKCTGYFIVLAILVLASTEFGLVTTELKDISENINMVKYSHLRIAIQMKIAFYINKIVLLVKETDPKMTATDKNANITSSKKTIETALNEYYDVQNQITLSKLSLSNQHSNLYTSKSVTLYYKNSSSQNSNKEYTLTEAIQQLASETFTVQSFSTNTNFAVGNDDIDFILYNAFSDLYNKMVLSSNLYVKELSDRGTDKQVMVFVLFGVAMLVCVVSVAFLFPNVASVSSTRLDVLSLFFDIPQSSVKALEKKCEKFVAQANDENVDDVMSNEGEVLIESPGAVSIVAEAAEANPRVGIHKKRFKNNTTSNTTFYLQFLLAMLVIAGYFSFLFAYGYIFLKSIEKYSRELNATTSIHSDTAVSCAIYQNLLGHRRLLMYDENTTFEYLATTKITQMYSIASEVQNSHNENGETFTTNYQNTFIEVMRTSLCSGSKDYGFSFTCSSFLDGTLNEGLHPVIIHFIEELRQKLSQYRTVAISSGSNATTINATLSTNFLQSSDMLNTEKTIFEVIDYAMRYLIEKLISSYRSKYDSEITLRIVLFICFIICFLISFLAIWTPFTNQLNDEIWRTKNMLTLIPYDVCKNIVTIKQFLSQQTLFSNKIQT